MLTKKTLFFQSLIQQNLLFLSFLDLPSNKEKTRVFAESIFILDVTSEEFKWYSFTIFFVVDVIQHCPCLIVF